MEDLNTSTDSSQLSQSSSDDEELVFLGGPEPKRPRVVSSSSSESDDMVFPDDGCSEEPSGDASVASDSIAGKVVQVLSETCCPAQCMWNLTIKEAFTSRMKFRSLSNNQQRQWIADKLVENSTISQGEIDTTYLVAGKVVCKTAFTKIHGFSMSRLQRAKKSVSQGQLLISQHGNTGRRKSTSAVEEATVWMERYFHLIGDKQPDKNRIHLPSWETKEDVYHRYEDDMKLRSVFPIGLSTFYRIWNENCPNVVIPKEDRFTKCDTCVKLKLEKKTGILDKQHQQLLQTELKQHLQRVELERKKYQNHREKSRAEPEMYMTIIIDGMDQAKTNIPQTKMTAKSQSGLWKLRTHVTGVLVHTKSPRGKLAYAFVDLLEYPHDSNLTITIILKVLVQFTEVMKMLPENLYIQMDNTSRENKNRYVLAFCALPVQLKIFKKVQVNFLPVGHTHEDVDQLFSRIGDKIRKSGCESLPELLTAIHDSYTPHPTASLVDGVFDFKSYFEPYLNKIEGHSKYAAFRFLQSDDLGVEMHYKQSSSDPWEPTKKVNEKLVSDKGLQIIQGLSDCSQKPDLLHPDVSKLDLNRLLADLPKYKPWLSPSAWCDWEKFMSNTDSLTRVADVPWDMQKLISSAIKSSSSRCTRQAQLSEGLSNILMKEKTVPKKIKVANQPTSQARGEGANQQSEDAREANAEVGEGTFVGVYLDKYQDERFPIIGQVTKMCENGQDIELDWYVGCYSGPWKICKVRGKVWSEVISLTSVLCSVTFTKRMKLTASSVDALKAAYTKFE